MANRYPKAAGGDWETDATWSATGFGGSDSVLAPTSSDAVIFQAGSGEVTVSSGNPVCASLDMSACTAANKLTFDLTADDVGITATNDVTVGGTLQIIAGDGVEASITNSGHLTKTTGMPAPTGIYFYPEGTAKNIRCNGVAGGNIEPTGTMIAVDAQFWDTFSIAGAYNGGGFAHTVISDIVVCVAPTNAGVWAQTGSGLLAVAYALPSLTTAASGQTVTMNAAVIVNKLTLGAGTLTGAQSLTIRPLADNFFVQDPANTLVCSAFTIDTNNVGTNFTNAGPIKASGATGNCTVAVNGGKSLTFNGPITFGARPLALNGVNTNNAAMAFNAGLRAGAVTVSRTDLTGRAVQLSLGGPVNVTSIVRGNAGNTGCSVAFNGCVFNATGTNNWTGLATTAAGAQFVAGLIPTLTSGWGKAWGLAVDGQGGALELTPKQLGTMPMCGVG